MDYTRAVSDSHWYFMSTVCSILFLLSHLPEPGFMTQLAVDQSCRFLRDPGRSEAHEITYSGKVVV